MNLFYKIFFNINIYLKRSKVPDRDINIDAAKSGLRYQK